MSVDKSYEASPEGPIAQRSSQSRVGHEFVSFSDIRLHPDSGVELPVAQRMIDRLAELDAGGKDLPTTDAGKAALACSIVAHAIMELEERYIARSPQVG
jgi:hypothetical protein